MGHYKKIMVALMGDGSEQLVIEHAVNLSNDLKANLVVIHVNDPHAGKMSMMMDSPKKVTADMIQDQIKEYGYESILGKIEFIIAEGERIPKTIEQHCKDFDLLIVGHRKMSEFKASIMDSVDEGITNLVHCPVIVVQKD
ncbi:MAG TPA: universal stress protein [Candidatus Marinimicrobia bacterium]|jgi:nucleotide-binding universal stress UspA family protein|nr:universal stress protein [Candidatus Neomarinimicrobiota bacterium]